MLGPFLRDWLPQRLCIFSIPHTQQASSCRRWGFFFVDHLSPNASQLPRSSCLLNLRTHNRPRELSVRGQGDQVGVRTIATFPGCATVLQADPQGRLILGSIFGNFIAVLQPRKNKTSDNAISRGKVLFGTLGCASCYSVLVDDKTRILTAPSLADVKLRAAKKVAGLNSEQYLRESIEHPAKFIVQGYSPTMPPTDSLDTKQMQSLIEYLQSL